MDNRTTQLVFSRDAVREVDRRAIGQFGIPGLVLMENAARGVAEFALSYMRERSGTGRVLAVCGNGNNGGDAMAAARHLHNAGVKTTVALTRPMDSLTRDAAVHLHICGKMGLKIVDCSGNRLNELTGIGNVGLILDGLLGTGLTGPVRPPLHDVIAWMNQQGSPIIAIDIPSGLDCDTGLPLGAAVKAAATVTFVGLKKGFLTPQSHEYTGEIHVVDIGVPRELAESMSVSRFNPPSPLS